MNVACVRHEAGRQRDNSSADLSVEQRAIRLDVLSRGFRTSEFTLCGF
jgi:hypothetical protein